tara:strand:- start:6584 stop:7174 length:591 start_codon:yes stop_codon:yes gene_type:complete
MKIVGLTGGIGSGKTTIAKMFIELGVPVYIADDEAKSLTNRSKVIRRKLIALLGEKAYTDSGLNREFVADRIFSDKELLASVNAIIHPKVASHFKKWAQKQDAPYVIKEAAILFENGAYKQCDVSILVISDEEERIKRVMKRDKSTRLAVERRMENQWSDKKKAALADIVIENSDLEKTRKEVRKIHISLSSVEVK